MDYACSSSDVNGFADSILKKVKVWEKTWKQSYEEVIYDEFFTGKRGAKVNEGTASSDGSEVLGPDETEEA